MSTATNVNDPTQSATPAAFEPDFAGLFDASTQALARGEHERGLNHARSALAAASSQADRAKALTLASTHAWRLGDFVTAYEAGHAALDASNGLDPLAESNTLCALSLVCAEIGAYGESVSLATRAFDLAQTAGSPSRMAVALNAVGTAHYRIGDHALGRDCLLRALSHAEQQSDTNSTLSALNNLCAGALVAHHDHSEAGLADEAMVAAAEAVNYARRSVAAAEPLGDTYRLAAVTCNLGEALGLSGDTGSALTTLEVAEAAARQHGFFALEMHVRRVVGEMLVRDARLEAAVQHISATLDLMHADDVAADRSRAHPAMYRALKGLGRFEESLSHCEATLALERRRTTEQARTLAALTVNRSDVQMAQLESERAREQNVQLKSHARAMEEDALHDPLTGLGNRRLLDRVLRPVASNALVSVAVLDIDHFKQINDRFGHPVGDAVLCELASMFKRCLRETDTAVRLGGEEFGFVLMPATVEVARAVCERVRTTIEAADWERLAVGLRVTASRLNL